MTDESDADHISGEHAAGQRELAPSHEEMLASRLPPQEREQPDPVLRLSIGRVGAGWITLVAVAAAIIIIVVFYGLNSPAPNVGHAASPPAATATPGGAAAAKPAATPSSKNGT